MSNINNNNNNNNNIITIIIIMTTAPAFAAFSLCFYTLAKGTLTWESDSFCPLVCFYANWLLSLGVILRHFENRNTSI